MKDWSNISREDSKLISKIVDRAIKDFPDILIDKMSLNMDISVAHMDCPLRLKDLLKAKSQHFGHDVWGINLYLNRNTGKLNAAFCPRFAVPIKSSKNKGKS